MKFGNMPKFILRLEVKTMYEGLCTIKELIREDINEDIIHFEFTLEDTGISKLWIDTETRKFHLITTSHTSLFKERE